MSRARTLGLAAVAVAVAASTLPAAASRPPTRHFSAPTHVDTRSSNLTGEPSIAVAPDGTEYIVAPDGPGARVPAAAGGAGTGGSLIWRSDDHGRSWSFLGSYDLPTGGGDSDIAIAPDGTLYGSGLSYLACSTVAVSTDKGQHWVDDPVAGCGRVPVSNDRQWNAVDGQRSVLTVIGDTTNNQIDLIRSLVDTPAVVPTQTIQLSTTNDYQWPGTVAVDQRNGLTYTVWNTQGAPNDCDGAPGADSCKPAQASTKTPDRIEVSVLPRGATAAPKPVVIATRRFDTFDSFVVVDVDKAGNAYVVWNERHPAQRATWVMLSVSRNGGRSWSTPVKVNSAPVTTTFPWVTAGDNGRIAVSYYGTASRGNSPQTVPGGAKWYVYSAFSTDGGRRFAEYRTTGVMNVGTVCTSGTGCQAGSRNLLDFFETAADPRGCLVTAYADNSAGGKAAIVSYVRQTSGPGLRSGTRCG